METWGDRLVPLEITISEEETDSIQWAVDQLRTDFADYTTGIFATEMVKAVRQANGPDRVKTVLEYTELLHIISQSLISRKNEKDGLDGLEDAIQRYEVRAVEDHKYQGMTFGIEEIDQHTFGIHDGEMWVLAGTSGGGKSWWSTMTLINEWKKGRKAVLFTLENDVEMTFDRIACTECRVDYEKFQRGECDEGDVLRVKTFAMEMEKSSNRPLVVQPDTSEATGAAMVRRAVVEGAQSIIIDQLSHIEAVSNSKARQRNEVVAEIVKELYKLVKQHHIACLLLHQINRKGRDEARKTGRFLMDYMGEATQIENAVDGIFAIYQSPDDEIAEQAQLQQLKGRRMKKKDFLLRYRPAIGDVRFIKELVSD